MAQDGRILYISYDSVTPSGGVKTIYHHVSHLAKNGYRAFVVHNKSGFSPTWINVNVPTLYMEENFRVYPNDIVVLPEDHHVALDAFKNIHVRKFIFCQNHFYIFSGLRNNSSWKDFDISGVFCCSDVIAEFIKLVFHLDPVPVIHNAISSDLFKPLPKKLQVAFMPRKRPTEIEFIRNIFQRVYPDYKHIQWVEIDKEDESKVAQILGESAIFLSTSLYEGFGLPPLEAMSCGCLVIGFHGAGGLDYATSKNGFWCEEGNLFGCSKTLVKVVSSLICDGDDLEKIKQQAIMTAKRYSIQRQEKEVVQFWSKIYP